MLKEIRRFTEAGEQEFRNLLLEPTIDGIDTFFSRLFEDTVSIRVFEDVEVPDEPASRFELAASLYNCQSDSQKISLKDKKLWNWLGAFYLCSEAKKSGQTAHVGDIRRWLVSESPFYEYRHLILSPFLAYSAHVKNPRAAMCVLAQPIISPGDVVEAIQSTPEIAYSVCAAVATKLYFDEATGKIKKGAGGKGPGSSRRLAASYLNQIRVNLDIRGMSEEELLKLLPAEFDRFKSALNQEGQSLDNNYESGLFVRLRRQLGMD
jgi:hypothetical protein